MKRPRKTVYAFVGGLILGLAVYHGALLLSGQAPVSRELLDEQQARLEGLRQENIELTEDLFAHRGQSTVPYDPREKPYTGLADAVALVSEARSEARAQNKFLMVTFGANWCADCRTLQYHLNSEPVAGYTSDLFRFVFVDVGKLNQNRDVAKSLGVSLSRGIPVAVVFDPEGRVIGTTNDGQLEPARYYSSKQILKFVRDIAEHSRILAPDSVE